MINFPKKKNKGRLSVSVPFYLEEWAREIAKANNVAVSAVVEKALHDMKAQELSNEIVRAIIEDSKD